MDGWSQCPANRRDDRNGAAFQRRQASGVVYQCSSVCADANAAGSGSICIRYSNVVILSQELQRRAPAAVEGNSAVRVPTTVVAAAKHHEEMTLKVIAKYTHLKDPKLIEEVYNDAVRFCTVRPAG